jgi:nicotinamide mononucleotide transporter
MFYNHAMNLQTSKWLKPVWHSWNLVEILLISFNVIVAIGMFIYGFFDSSFNIHNWKEVIILVVSFFANITNAMCFILIAKKKVSNYIWGMVAVLLLGTVAFYYENTGTWIINWIFYVPTQAIGLFLWYKNSQKSHHVVQSRQLKWWVILTICVVAIGTVVGLTFVNALPGVQKFFYNEAVTDLKWINWTQFFCDAAVLVVSPIAMILMMLRYRENLAFWIAVDVLLVLLWTVTLITEGNISAIQMILSWGTVLLLVIYGQVYWKLSQK